MQQQRTHSGGAARFDHQWQVQFFRSARGFAGGVRGDDDGGHIRAPATADHLHGFDPGIPVRKVIIRHDQIGRFLRQRDDADYSLTRRASEGITQFPSLVRRASVDPILARCFRQDRHNSFSLKSL